MSNLTPPLNSKLREEAMEKIDFNRPYETIYLQDGKQFNASGELIGPVPTVTPMSKIGGDYPDPPEG